MQMQKPSRSWLCLLQKTTLTEWLAQDAETKQAPLGRAATRTGQGEVAAAAARLVRQLLANHAILVVLVLARQHHTAAEPLPWQLVTCW